MANLGERLLLIVDGVDQYEVTGFDSAEALNSAVQDALASGTGLPVGTGSTLYLKQPSHVVVHDESVGPPPPSGRPGIDQPPNR